MWIAAIVAFENGDKWPRVTLPGLDIPLRTQIKIETAHLFRTMAPLFVPGGHAVANAAEGLSEREIFDRTETRPFAFWINYGKVPDAEIAHMRGLTDAEKRALRKDGCYGVAMVSARPVPSALLAMRLFVHARIVVPLSGLPDCGPLYLSTGPKAQLLRTNTLFVIVACWS